MIRFAAFCLILAASPAAAQNRYDPAVRIAAQREAMARLAFMDGVWRGPAWSRTQQGRREMIQTERIGAMLDGSIKVMEGRGYAADGAVAFNAFGVVSFDLDRRVYNLTTWALGFSVTVPLTITETGFVWETPAGPGAILRYTATIRNGTWHEVGDRIAGDAPPVRTVELTLRRIGDSAWPAGDPVPMR